ncbi:MAG: HNH endonuclease, partial [Gammaproteobacteria bacterium]|nr:HNH endonuclease [Gammaproteobacteria bacterium]
WSRVAKRGRDACWLWTGATFVRGEYGAVRFEGKTQRANRVAYRLAVGLVSAGKKILHSCDNPPCCNPKHLYQGTDLDNVRDMDSRGRRKVVIPKGTDHWAAKLTPKQVMKIRSLPGSQRVLAKQFGVNRTTIARIRDRTIWRDL